MPTYSNLDAETLKGVHAEALASVDSAQSCIGKFIADDDEQALVSLVEQLHQLSGLLTMLELKALFSLTTETEKLTRDFIHGDSKISHAAYLGLVESVFEDMTASLQRLSGSDWSLSVNTVELVNQIRAVRGLDAVEISSLFSPNIDIYPVIESDKVLSAAEYTERAIVLRAMYQLHLLQWLKDAHNKDSLAKMRMIVDKLYRMSTFGVVARLWWVSRAYIDFIENNALQNKSLHVRILRQLNDRLRDLETVGESALVKDPSEELLKLMLYYIATAEHRSEHMNDVINTFSLSAYLVQTNEGAEGVLDDEETQASLARLSSETNLDLASLRNMLNHYFEADGERNEHLESIQQQMEEVCDSATRHQVSLIADLSDVVMQTIDKLAKGTVERNEETAFHLAAAILFIENSLDGDHTEDDNWQRSGADKQAALQAINDGREVEEHLQSVHLSGGERRALLEIVSFEVENNLKDIETSLELFSENQDKFQLLEGIDGRIRQIRGALQVLGEHKIGLLLQMVEGQFVGLQNRTVDASDNLIEALAISIGTMEAYVNGLQSGQANMGQLLDRSITDLEVAIGKRVSRDDVERLLEDASESLFHWLDNQADFSLFTTLKSNLRDLLVLAKKTKLTEVEHTVEELSRTVDIISQEPVFLNQNVTTNLQNNMANVASQIIELYGTEETDEEWLADAEQAYKKQAIKASDSDQGLRYHDDMDVSQIEEFEDVQQAQNDVSVLTAAEELENNAPQIDETILDVFMEESDEVLEEASRLLDTCKADYTDIDSVRSLRRQFHTMKGSSRMVGLINIGDIAWYGESLLNYVLDTDKPLTADIVSYSERVLTVLKEQFSEHYENQHLLETESWGEQAARLAQEQTDIPAIPEEQTVSDDTDTSIADSSENESVQNAAPLDDASGIELDFGEGEEVADVLELSEDLGLSEVSDDQVFVDSVVDYGDVNDLEVVDNIETHDEHEVEFESAGADVEIDDEEIESTSLQAFDDVEMRTVFLQECNNNVQIAKSELAKDDLVVTQDDALSVAMHTMMGNCRTMKLAELADVYASAENLCLDKGESQQALTDSQKQALLELLEQTSAYLPELENLDDQAELPERDWSAINEKIQQSIHDQDVHEVDVVSEPDTSADLDNSEGVHQSVDAIFNKLDDLSGLIDDDIVEAVPEEAPAEQQETDDEFEELAASLSSASLDLEQPAEEADDQSQQQAPADELVDEAPSDDQPAVDEGNDVIAIELEDLLEDDILQADNVVELADTSQNNDDVEVVSFDESDTREDISEPDSDIEDNVEDDNLSDELKAIFVDEAKDLYVDIDGEVAKLTALSDAPAALSNVMRHLHTLKGSSRMAGANEISDTTHAMESYLESHYIRDEASLKEVKQVLERFIDAVNTGVTQFEQDKPIQIDADLNALLGVENIQISQESAQELDRLDDQFDHVDLHEDLERSQQQFETLLERWQSAQTWTDIQPELLNELQQMEALIYSSEDLSPLQAYSRALTQSVESRTAITDDAFKQTKSLFEEALDVLVADARNLLDGKDTRSFETLLAELQALSDQGAAELPGEQSPQVDTMPPEDVETPDASQEVEPVALISPRADNIEDASLRPTRERINALRIQAEALDSLTNYVGDSSMNRSQMREDVLGIKSAVDDLYSNVRSFERQLRELEIEADSKIAARDTVDSAGSIKDEFDPLELDRYTKLQQLSRGLAENLDELGTIQNQLSGFVHRTETKLQKQDRLNRELQDELMQVRLVSFGGLAPQLRQVVRQTAREVGKEVELVIIGSEVRLDKNILDDISPAIEHIIRNAIDHGIESADVRVKNGKPETGKITIECRQVAREIIINIRDDGSGLDLDAIRRQAIKNNLLTEKQELKLEDVLLYISKSGFSTAEQLTQVSGRGIGMDVVQSVLRKMSGNIAYDPTPQGTGASFTMRLPISMAVTSAMFVEIGGENSEFAISTRMIERVVNLSAGQISEVLEREVATIDVDGEQFSLLDMAAYLGLKSVISETAPDEKLPVILVYSGAQNIAVVVEKLKDTQEIVVKNLGDHLGRIPIYAGATIRADGRVVLLLDLIGLSFFESFTALPQGVEDQQQQVEIMVVDDSLTVRKSAERDLNSLGIHCVMAKDGLDAQEQLASYTPDMILLDIEMPRMDGFELLEWVKSEPSLKDVPVVMISSRATEKYVQKASSLGCSAFMGKPYALDDLVAVMNEFLTLDYTIEMKNN